MYCVATLDNDCFRRRPLKLAAEETRGRKREESKKIRLEEEEKQAQKRRQRDEDLVKRREGRSRIYIVSGDWQARSWRAKYVVCEQEWMTSVRVLSGMGVIWLRVQGGRMVPYVVFAREWAKVLASKLGVGRRVGLYVLHGRIDHFVTAISSVLFELKKDTYCTTILRLVRFMHVFLNIARLRYMQCALQEQQAHMQGMYLHCAIYVEVRWEACRTSQITRLISGLPSGDSCSSLVSSSTKYWPFYCTLFFPFPLGGMTAILTPCPCNTVVILGTPFWICVKKIWQNLENTLYMSVLNSAKMINESALVPRGETETKKPCKHACA